MKNDTPDILLLQSRNTEIPFALSEYAPINYSRSTLEHYLNTGYPKEIELIVLKLDHDHALDALNLLDNYLSIGLPLLMAIDAKTIEKLSTSIKTLVSDFIDVNASLEEYKARISFLVSTKLLKRVENHLFQNNLKFSDTEADVFKTLENSKAPISIDDLRHEIHSIKELGPNNIKVHIANIRKKIKNSGVSIHTEDRRFYFVRMND